MISIIITLYNEEKRIASYLRQLLEQSYNKFEVILVDDGSTDNTLREAEKVQDPRVQIIRQAHAGVQAARNKGIAAAKGDFVTFPDLDNEWHHDFLIVFFEMTNYYPQCDIFITNYAIQKEDGTVVRTRINNTGFRGMIGILSNYFQQAAGSHILAHTPAVVVRKSVLKEMGNFPLDILHEGDALTWVRIIARSRVAYMKSSMVTYNEIPLASQNIDIQQYVADLDEVSLRLNQLLPTVSRSMSWSMKRYFSEWHLVQSRHLAKVGKRGKARKFALRAFIYNPFNWRCYIAMI